MKILATQKFIRTSPRKIRLVAKSLHGINPELAIKKLKFINKRSADTVSKVIKQALANATNNHNLPTSRLVIDSIQVNEGPTFKRWNAVSRGRAHSILKRSSHIKVTLESKPLPVVAAPKTASKPKTKTTTSKKNTNQQTKK